MTKIVRPRPAGMALAGILLVMPSLAQAQELIADGPDLYFEMMETLADNLVSCLAPQS